MVYIRKRTVAGLSHLANTGTEEIMDLLGFGLLVFLFLLFLMGEGSHN
jgi:hypothetical protein